MSRRLLFLLSVAFFGVSLSAHRALAQAPHETAVQKRAEALIGAARQLSDIRSSASAPFRLSATFTFVADTLETVNGTYTEVWISKSQWRRAIDIGASQQIEVASSGKLWILDKPEDFPEKAKLVVGMMRVVPGGLEKLDFESIAEHAGENPPTVCAISKEGSAHEKHAYCFEKKSGALLEAVSPRMHSTRVSDYACDYGMFKKFGDYWFPREMACFEDRHRMVDAKVVDLVAENKPDPDLFAPPTGAVELDFCPDTETPAVAKSTTLPIQPFGIRDEPDSIRVPIAMVIDTKGRTQKLRLLHPGQGVLDKEAMAAVRRWRFKPATCNGTPMTTQMDVDVPFQRISP